MRLSPFDSWNRFHALACLCSVPVSLALSSAAPTLVTGAASLGVFAARHGTWSAPNAVTALRTALVSATFLIAPQSGIALSAAAAVALSLDWLDGALARRLGGASEFGAAFDMESDAWMVLMLSLALVLFGLPVWALLLGALRYALVLFRWALRVTHLPERRSRTGRWVYFSVVLGLLILLVAPDASWATAMLATLVAALTWSFAPYFGDAAKAARRANS